MEDSAIDIGEKLNYTYGKSKGGMDEKKNYVLMEKNNKKVFELLEHLEKDYEKIKFIVEEEDYEKSEKFNNFMLALERQNDLDKTTLERNSRLERIKATIQEKQKYLQTLKKAALNRTKAQDSYDITDEKVEKQITKDIKETEKHTEAVIKHSAKIQQALLQSKVSIATICRKLGIDFRDDQAQSDLPFAEIHAKIGEKINLIKEKSDPEVFDKLWKGEYDIDQLYKNSLRPGHLPKPNEDAVQTLDTQGSIVSQD